MGAWCRQLHLYDHGHPDVHEIYREFRALLDWYPGDRVSIGELHHEQFDVWAGFYGQNLDEIHVPFNFHLLFAPWNSARIRSIVDAIEAALPDGAWPNWVLGNHDQRRIASRLGQAQARVAMLLLLTLRGTPSLYYGDELGLPDTELRPGPGSRSVGARRADAGTGSGRSPMPWDGTTNGGFCAPTRIRGCPSPPAKTTQRGRAARGSCVDAVHDPTPDPAAAGASGAAEASIEPSTTRRGNVLLPQVAGRGRRRSDGPRHAQPDRGVTAR